MRYVERIVERIQTYVCLLPRESPYPFSLGNFPLSAGTIIILKTLSLDCLLDVVKACIVFEEGRIFCDTVGVIFTIDEAVGYVKVLFVLNLNEVFDKKILSPFVVVILVAIVLFADAAVNDVVTKELLKTGINVGAIEYDVLPCENGNFVVADNKTVDKVLPCADPFMLEIAAATGLFIIEFVDIMDVVDIFGLTSLISSKSLGSTGSSKFPGSILGAGLKNGIVFNMLSRKLSLFSLFNCSSLSVTESSGSRCSSDIKIIKQKKIKVFFRCIMIF